MSDSELEEVGKQDYGRLNFRGVPMAYLTLGDQEKFTLTDVVCNLYARTPRTTVISRMDKMRIVRTPCTPEQIRKVKSAGGVHSSSVVCSLVSKQAIEAFCDKYPIDLPAGLNPTLVSEEELTRSDFTQTASKPGKKTNVIINPCKDKKSAIKKRRCKRSSLDAALERSLIAVMKEGCSPPRLSQDSTFSIQTPQSCEGCKTANDEKLLGKSVLDPNQLPSPGKSNKKRCFFPASAKSSKVIKNGFLPTKRKQQADGNEDMSPARKVKKVKLKHSNCEGRRVVNEVAQSTVNKVNSRRWLVDTLPESCSYSSSPSLADDTTDISSSTHSKHKNTSSPGKKEPFLSKDKSKNLKCMDSKKDPNITASPPSLILKRQGKRTWHVEQRTIENHSESIHNQLLFSNNHEFNFSLKKKIKTEPTDYSPEIENRKTKTKPATNNPETQAKIESGATNVKRKKARKGQAKFLRLDSFDSSEYLDQCEADLKRQKHKELFPKSTKNFKNCEMLMKKKKKRNGENRKEENALNGDQFTAKFKRGKVPKLRKIKTGPLDDEQFSQHKNNSLNLHQFPTPDSTPSATPTDVKPAKVVVKLTPVKPKLKANRKFKFMDIFSGEPSLTLKDGDLIPAYTLHPPQTSRATSQALMGWHLGGRVVGQKNVRYKVHSLK